MNIKRIFTGIVFAAVIALSACSKQDNEAAARDAELQQKLIGVWYYTESVVNDEDGNMISFSAYEFTDKLAKVHEVSEVQIASSLIDKYTIKDGYYTVEVNGKKEYAVIDIREVDGRDHLFWSIDTGTLEFVRMTDEEIKDYSIPAGKFLSGEAELLGIETTASESATIPEALATEADTSAVSE